MANEDCADLSFLLKGLFNPGIEEERYCGIPRFSVEQWRKIWIHQKLSESLNLLRDDSRALLYFEQILRGFYFKGVPKEIEEYWASDKTSPREIAEGISSTQKLAYQMN